MVGKGRHPILGVWSPDPVLSTVAPIGLAAAAGTALIVDLASTTRGTSRTLADLVSEGPKLAELSPGRPGIALLAGGNVDRATGFDILRQLGEHWPAVVIRTADRDLPFATVPVIPLFPGMLAPTPMSHGVWQPVGGGAEPPGPGPVLPRLRGGVIRRMLSGHLPKRSRWIAAWRPVWELPWA
jgi:hypothetical protein